MKEKKNYYKLRMEEGVMYVWLGGSCDYGREERAGGGACISVLNGEIIEEYAIGDVHTTEFRMLLKVMIHTMEIAPEDAKICFLTNVAYLQNFDKEPTEKSANADLIKECIEQKKRHDEVVVKLIPFHKYEETKRVNDMAHEAMLGKRL